MAGSEAAQRPKAGHKPLGLAGGIAVIAGSVVAAAVLFPAGEVSARLIVVAVAVGTCAALVPDTRVTFVVAGLGYLLFTGLLVNGFGGLRWNGADTVWYLVVLALATALGLGQRWIRAQADRDDSALQGTPR